MLSRSTSSVAVLSPRASGPISRGRGNASHRLTDWFEWAAAYARGAGLDVGPRSFRISCRQQALLWNGEVILASADPNELVAAAEYYVMSAWAEELAENYFVCHAAAVERNGLAVLLGGDGGAGKSTLALALVRRGFRLLGDEFAIVDPRTLEALPFPKAVSMKGYAVEEMAARDSHFDVFPYPPVLASGESRVPHCHLPREVVVPLPGERFPIGCVIMLSGDAAAGPPATISRSQAVKCLYELLWFRGERQFRAAARLARRVVTREMGRTNIAEMADWIERFCLPEAYGHKSATADTWDAGGLAGSFLETDATERVPPGRSAGGLAGGFPVHRHGAAMVRITTTSLSGHASQWLHADQEARARVLSITYEEVKKLWTALLPEETSPLVPVEPKTEWMPRAENCCA